MSGKGGFTAGHFQLIVFTCYQSPLIFLAVSVREDNLMQIEGNGV